jgi:hypothetical protein
MTRAEIDAFLARPLTCRLGCVDAEGAPYVVPVNYQYEEGAFFVFARERSAWAECLRREPRVALCVDLSDYDEGSWATDDFNKRVLVRGVAAVAAGPRSAGWPITPGDLLGEVAMRMNVRYSNGDEKAASEVAMHYAADPFWLFRIVPTTVTSWMGDWHPRYRAAT